MIVAYLDIRLLNRKDYIPFPEIFNRQYAFDSGLTAIRPSNYNLLLKPVFSSSLTELIL